jgi:hypothetical protein
MEKGTKYTNLLTPKLIKWKKIPPAPSEESERSCICVINITRLNLKCLHQMRKVNGRVYVY